MSEVRCLRSRRYSLIGAVVAERVFRKAGERVCDAFCRLIVAIAAHFPSQLSSGLSCSSESALLLKEELEGMFPRTPGFVLYVHLSGGSCVMDRTVDI